MADADGEARDDVIPASLRLKRPINSARSENWPMRLVRDDDVEVMQEQNLQQAQAEQSRHTSEEPDGAIDQAEEDDSSSAAAEVQVDLRTLEALLFSTHHPLT